jgi:hypothetical protein
MVQKINSHVVTYFLFYFVKLSIELKVTILKIISKDIADMIVVPDQHLVYFWVLGVVSFPSVPWAMCDYDNGKVDLFLKLN